MSDFSTFNAAQLPLIAIEALGNMNNLADLSLKYNLPEDQILQLKQIAYDAIIAQFNYVNSHTLDSFADYSIYKQKQEDLLNELSYLKDIIRTELPLHQRINLVDKFCADLIPITRQCNLLGISNSTYYYKPTGESEFNIFLMNAIDELYTQYPFYGSRRIVAVLNRRDDIIEPINRKRVSRLMNLMGLEAIYPKPKLSISGSNSINYPYLLKNLYIDHPNQVWCSDITYIRMQKGFLYLTVIMDWYSRYILSWEISNTLDSNFCIDALTTAINKFSHPDIFNSDQGSQFTSSNFQQLLLDNNVKISLDHKGRCFDNIMVERLWRSVKYEEVYIKSYITVNDAISSLNKYFIYYNNDRPHQSLSYNTPHDFYRK